MLIKKSITLALILFIFSLSALAQTSSEKFYQKLVGSWVGAAETPWTKNYKVLFEFYPDGTYASYGPQSCHMFPEYIPCLPESTLESSKPALYYGKDGYSKSKKLNIELVVENTAQANLEILFSGNSTSFSIVRNITISQDNKQLSFYFLHKGSYGPLRYQLKRVEE